MLLIKNEPQNHLCSIESSLHKNTILKELKYATHTSSIVMYVFDGLIKSLLEMSSRLLVACDEMRKRHLIDKINVKTLKTMKKKSKL